ncbi:hypothetical protein ACFLVH_04620 [Chloroflexota bacterium]
MKKSRVMISVLLSLLLTVGLALPVAALEYPIDPSSVVLDLEPGESIEIEKTITTPEIPLVFDILLLQDETGSMGNDIDALKAVAPDVWTALEGYDVDFQMGVAGFKDFARNPWGTIPGTYSVWDPDLGEYVQIDYGGDWVYRLLQDITGVEDDFVDGVNDLEALGGNDGPEAQLEALHYLATPGHAAIDSDGNDSTGDACDTPENQQPTWREGTQKVVLLATDAYCHLQGDLPDPGWPGCDETASVADMVDYLVSAGIVVIGLVPDRATIGCVNALATGTGGTVQDTGDAGEDIADAIISGLEALTTDVWWEVTSSDPGIEVSLTPEKYEDVPGDTSVTFTETITVTEEAEQCHTYYATVTFYANSHPVTEGALLGTQEISVHVLDVDGPSIWCVEAVNPHGDNVPGEKRSDKAKDKAVNPDGFYQIFAEDNCDEPSEIEIWIGTSDEPMLFGPYSSGIIVKLTEAPGAEPSEKKIGSTNGKAGAVTSHITLPSDPVMTAVDASGNSNTCTGCLVPPPSK